MREVVIARFVLAPAPTDLSTEDRERVFGRLAPGITNGKAVALLFQPGHFGFELINLAAQTSLPAIKWAGIQKEWTPDLVAIEINHAGGHQHSHSPIEAKHCLNLLKRGGVF